MFLMKRYDERVSTFTHTEFVTLQPCDRLGFADDVMKLGQIRHEISCLPVVDSLGSPVGLIAETDLLRAV
jgi:CBS domain-containing protein